MIASEEIKESGAIVADAVAIDIKEERTRDNIRKLELFKNNMDYTSAQAKLIERFPTKESVKEYYEQATRSGVEGLYMHKGMAFAMIISGFWAVTMWIGFVYGIVADGWVGFMSYFTNWMWSFGAVFYTIYVLGILDASGYVHELLILGVLWPYFANVMAVLFLAPIMLLEDSSMLTDAAKTFSWGLVHLVEWVKHSLTGVIILVFIICIKDDIYNCMSKIKYSTSADVENFWLYVLINLIACNAVAVGYSVNNDFHKVYHMKLNTWVAIVILEIIYFLFLIIPILASTPISDPYSKNPLVPSSRIVSGGKIVVGEKTA